MESFGLRLCSSGASRVCISVTSLTDVDCILGDMVMTSFPGDIFSGYMLCNSATDSASLMNCLAGLVNKWSRPSLVMESQSTPKQVSYRELTTLRMRWSRRGDHEMSS